MDLYSFILSGQRESFIWQPYVRASCILFNRLVLRERQPLKKTNKFAFLDHRDHRRVMLEQQALVQVKGTAWRSPPGNCSSSHPFTGQTHSGKTLFCYPSHCWHRPSWLCPAPTLRGWRKSLFAQLLLPCKIHIGKEEEISFSNDWHLQILLCITNLFSYLMYRLCLQHLVAIRFLPKSDQK